MPMSAGMMCIVALVPSFSAALTLHVRKPSTHLWDEALASFVDKIQANTSTVQEPTVVLTVAGGGHWRLRYSELLRHYRLRAGLPLAVVSLDMAAHGFFREHGVVSMLFDLPALGLKRHEQPSLWPWREAIMRGRYEVTSLLLDRGVKVIFSEMDVYWRASPLILTQEVAGDLLVMQNKNGGRPSVNAGFFIAKPTASTRRLFSNVRTWLNSDVRGETPCGTRFDHALLGYAIECSEEAELVGKCNLPAAEQTIVCDRNGSSLNWGYIPWKRLPHPPVDQKYGANMTHDMQEFMAALRTTALGVHLGSGFAHPHDQLAFAHDNGLWAEGAPWRASDSHLQGLGAGAS